MIRDQVVEKTNFPKLREKFLQNKDLTLSTVLKVGEAYERSLHESKLLEDSVTRGTNSVLQCSVDGAGSETEIRKVFPQTTQGAVRSSVTRCSNCGKPGHVPLSIKCPARSASCWNCGKQGHWASVCRSSGQKRPAITTCKEVTILACNTSSVDRIHAWLTCQWRVSVRL